MLEIKLSCPIEYDEVVRLRSELINSKSHEYVIIDIGTSNFASTATSKFFKEQLSDLEPCLTKFKKVALVFNPMDLIETSTPNKFDFFTSKKNAINWFSM